MISKESTISSGESNDKYLSDSSSSPDRDLEERELDTLLSLVDKTELLDILKYIKNNLSGLGLDKSKKA